MFLLFLISSTSRRLALVLFLSPFFGLFGLMIQFLMDSSMSSDLEVSKDLTDITWYTGLSRRSAFIILYSFPVLHAIIVFIIKSLMVKGFINPPSHDHLSLRVTIRHLYRGLLHCLSGLLGPVVWKDWDQETDNFTNRWNSVKKEYGTELALFCLENILLLFPLLHTCVRILERQSRIPTAEWLVFSCKLLLGSPVMFLVVAIVQYKLFVIMEALQK